jgi:glucosamine--fructose-6-phosphate aminotransferase (isomerizing)
LIDSSELLEHDFNYKSKNMLIVISQSGETIDTIVAMNKFKKLCNYIFSIVNVVGSSISELSDSGSYLNCGIEMGVASTKSFTSQCLVLLLCAIWISNFKKVKIDHSKTINSIRNLSSNISKILSNYDEIADLSYLINDSSKLFLLSGGISKAVADEGSLKIKEISYLNCQSYQVSSLKHGPFALIDSDTILIYIASYDDSEIYRKSLISISETKTRGSINIFITDKIPENSDSIDHLIIIPTSCLLTFPILSVIPLQILAYKLSINRNINPDFPRNLAKSVTVE